jgi:hypothetical protein
MGPEIIYVSGRTRASGEMNGKSANLNNCLAQIYPAGVRIPATELACVFDADQARPPPARRAPRAVSARAYSCGAGHALGAAAAAPALAQHTCPLLVQSASCVRRPSSRLRCLSSDMHRIR